MNLTIDSIIFLTFLVLNLGVGLIYSTGMKNAREYAIGLKDFSTGTITATVIATCIGGGFFSGAITESYKDGLYFIIPALGEPVALIMMGYFLIPRMTEFLKNVSVAEAMGDLYGKPVRVITAISSILLCVGLVALQFKVASTVMKIFFDVSSLQAVVLSAVVVILYSSFGGIKAVTFTDVIQFFTFGTIIPILSLIIWNTFDEPTIVINTISHNPIFDFKEVFDFSNPRFVSCLCLFVFFIFPGGDPAYFQRVAMAKSPAQAKKAFILAGLIIVIILMVVFWISVLILSSNPNLDPNNLISYIINTYSYTGLKGIVAIGIMAIVMSTADSYTNCSAILITNDLLKPLIPSFVKEKHELTILRIIALSVGIFALFLAFRAGSILDMLELAFSFYMPVVDIALVAAILGFRPNSKVVLIGMMAGIITVALWPWYGIEGVGEVTPGMIANLAAFMISYYILGRPRIPLSKEYTETMAELARVRKHKWRKAIEFVTNFSFREFCAKNLPRQESIYTFFGLFSIVSIFSSMYSMPIEIRTQHKDILDIIYHSVLISSSIFLTYPIWPKTLKSERFMSVFWLAGLFYILVFVSCLQVIISNFGQFQSMIFLVNLLVLSIIARWNLVLPLVILGLSSSILFFKWRFGIELSLASAGTLQFKIMYILLAVTSISIGFIKPNQEAQDLSEEQKAHLSERIATLDKELKHALSLKSEFIKNITHEYHAPMTGLISMSQTLSESYNKLSDTMRKKAASTIFESAIKLTHFDTNISNLSRLSKENVELKIEQVDLSLLVSDSIESCRKLYANCAEDKYIVTAIDDNIIVQCDKYYVRQAIDNLIINAFEYCKKGKISISLTTNADGVMFTISDDGIGIPLAEIHDIFEAFTVSSKTKTPAGGRGVGLAIAKKVVDLHQGRIWAESDGKHGSIFRIVLNK